MSLFLGNDQYSISVFHPSITDISHLTVLSAAIQQMKDTHSDLEGKLIFILSMEVI